jgi:hypothetical protein
MIRPRVDGDGWGPCALRGAALNDMRPMTRIERMNWNQQLPDRTTCADFKDLDAGRAFPADRISSHL